METSAKTGMNIDLAFHAIAKLVYIVTYSILHNYHKDTSA